MTNPERETEPGTAVPTFRRALGARLRELEKQFRNREAAAEAAGVGKSTLQSWIDGRAGASFEGIARFAEATGVSMDWLATGRTGSFEVREGGSLETSGAAQLSEDGAAFKQPDTHDLMARVNAYVEDYVARRGGTLNETQKRILISSIWDLVVNKGETLESPVVDNMIYLAISNG